MNITIKATARCSRTGCAAHFDYEFYTSDVSAKIESGGSVALDWPTPDVPEGWDADWSDLYCPEHRPPTRRKKP